MYQQGSDDLSQSQRDAEGQVTRSVCNGGIIEGLCGPTACINLSAPTAGRQTDSLIPARMYSAGFPDSAVIPADGPVL
ncbi:hypothetical protein N7540_013164 [Penicillium herquei]|nr:hypothetical protein N7540_013164 [Penicillium herquei]